MSFRELFDAIQAANSVKITFRSAENPPRAVTMDFTQVSRWGSVCAVLSDGTMQPRRNFHGTIDQLFDRAAEAFSGVPVRYESLTLKTSKSPLDATELTPLVLDALSERLEQPVPDDDAMKALKKAYKADLAREKAARDAKKALQERRQEKRQAVQRAMRQPDKKVTDVPSFLEALNVRIGDQSRIKKAMKMLKKDGFELFNDVSDDQVVGVVKSQTDHSLVYACRLQADGSFCCCTQNLNVCGGLRGRACKHLLVLLIGLVQQGELDPVTVDRWLDKHLDTKPQLDRDAMGDVFLKYKGAEAGELDWRPTETTPEDFYAY